MEQYHSIRGTSAREITIDVEQAIRDGHLGPGARLPTVRALAHDLSLSPVTVASAYRALQMRGLVIAEGRRGTRVSHQPPVRTATAVSLPSGVRNLADGNPDPALLPVAGLSRKLLLPPVLYGERAKEPELVSLASREFAADGIAAGPIAVVGGALDGIERVLQGRLLAGDRVSVEDPGHPQLLDLISALGLVPDPVKIDSFGVVSSELERALSRGVRAFIITPRAQNPTGAALTAERATELRQLLLRYPRVLVIEDDHAGAIAGSPGFTVTDGDRDAWAVVRSFAKSLGPDLRLAVLTGDETTVARVEGRQLLGIGWVSHVLQRLAVELLRAPACERLLREAAETYARRRTALVEALGTRGIAAYGRSGLNVWVPILEEARTVQVMLEAGWAISPGERFRLASPPAVRITTATLEPDEADQVATDLGQALRPGGRTYMV